MRTPLSPIAQTTVEIDSWSTVTPGGAKPRARAKAFPEKRLAFSDLFSETGKFGVSKKAAQSLEGEGQGSETGTGVGMGKVGTGFGKSVRLAGVHQRLFELIDQGLNYPEELYDHGDQGVVRVDLLFSGAGLWAKEKTRVRGANDFLRVYVKRLLPKVLRTSLGTRFSEAFTVSAEFHFEIERRLPINHLQQNQHLQNMASKQIGGRASGSQLTFVRVHHLWSPISIVHFEEDKRDLDGSPTRKRSGIAVDLMPLLEGAISSLSDLISPKAKLDPLELYRRDPAFAESD